MIARYKLCNITVYLITIYSLFMTSISVADTDGTMIFSATVERISGSVDVELPQGVEPGSKFSGQIRLMTGERFVADPEMYTWRTGANQYTGRVAIESPFEAKMDNVIFEVHFSHGGKLAVNCPPSNAAGCDTSGGLPLSEDTFWNVKTVSIQAPSNEQLADNLTQLEAAELLKELSNNGGSKMLIAYENPEKEGDVVRVILNVDNMK